MYTKIEKCRICGNDNLISVLDLGMQKLTGVFPLPGQTVNEAPLELVKCIPRNERETSCGLVQLRYSCSGKEMYGDNYGYRSGLNKNMVNHLEDISAMIEGLVQLENGDIVLDIGSNDATLLKSYKHGNLDLVGMDPTGIKFKKYYTNNIELVTDFFSAENFIKIRKHKKAKVITSIAMFYDLENPQKFVDDIARILDNNGIWVMEQSYLPAMLEANSYDTICQEHLEFYCLAQIRWLVERSGMKIINVKQNKINGGSFQLIVAKNESDYRVNDIVEELSLWELENGYNTLNPFKKFRKEVELHKKQLLKFLKEEKSKGKVILGYGASTKGNVLLQYCGITSEYIEAIADVNEDKFGCATPGTNIPIISEDKARSMRPDYFIVLPWHFRDFILSKEESFIKETNCKFVFPLPRFEIV